MVYAQRLVARPQVPYHVYFEAICGDAAVQVEEDEGGLLVAGHDAEVAAGEELVVLLEVA